MPGLTYQLLILQICEGGGFKRAVLKKMLFIFFSEKDELEHKFASRVIFEALWEMNGSRDIALHTPPIPRTYQMEQLEF